MTLPVSGWPPVAAPVAASARPGGHASNFAQLVFPEEAMVLKEKPYKMSPPSGWRRVVHGFTPNWFSVTMGTGIVSILLFDIPYQSSWLYWVSVVIFLLDVLMFVVFLVVTILRYILYPHLFQIMLQDLGQSLFIGTIPMGLGTIITMLAQLGEPVFGQPAITAAWILWWIDITMSIACCFSAPFLLMNAHKKEFKYVTAAWLLPIIPTIVASATGVVVANFQTDPQHALWTITTCYVLLGSGLPLAFSILVIYLCRLILFRFPSKNNALSVFFPLGPLGQGAFAIQKLGVASRETFLKTNTLDHASTGSGNILYTAGWIMGLLLWGFAMFWLFVAVVHVFWRKFTFNMSWWALTFPLGTVATATLTFGKDMPSAFFDILGTVFAVCVILLWILCSVQTCHHALNGDLFAID